MKILLNKLKHYFSGKHEKNQSIIIHLFKFNKEHNRLMSNYWCLNIYMFALNYKKWMTHSIFNIYNPLDKDMWKLSFNLSFKPDSYFSRVEDKRTKKEDKSLTDKNLSVRESMVVREISLQIQLLFIEFIFNFNFDYLLKYELSSFMEDNELTIKYYRPSSLNIKTDDDWTEFRLKNSIL